MKTFFKINILLVLLAVLFSKNAGAVNAVGASTAGQFAVSPSGTATYSIPIACPAGINGLQPNVSLNYNSQAGNGIAGVGFSIAGSSMISRASKDIYHDNAVSAIDWTKNSPFTLDGNRLMVINTWGTDSIEYRTENDNFSRVVGVLITTYGPTYFKVYQKNGQKCQYGTTDGVNKYANYYLNNDGSKRLGWMLTEITDINGNRMSYYYSGEISGTNVINHRLISISYANNKNVSMPYYCSIAFEYETRTDEIRGYIDGQLSLQQKRLKAIVSKPISGEYRRYNLEYALSDETQNKSNLTQITEIGSNGEQLNSSIIKWNTTNNTNLMKTESISSAEATVKDRFFAVDYNGDGISDILSYYADNYKPLCMATQEGIICYGEEHENFYYGNNMLRGNSIKTDSEIFSRFYSGSIPDNFYGLTKNVYPCYYNHSNIPVIISPYKIPYFNQIQFKNIKDGSLVAIINIDIDFIYSVADINNDGYDDIVIIEQKKSGNAYPAHILYGHSKTLGTEIQQDFSLELTAIPKEIIISDFNADGLKDLGIVQESGYQFFKNKGGVIDNTSIAKISFGLIASGDIFNNKFSTLKQGDFNGDGLPDFILNEHCNRNWYLAINNGDFTFNKIAQANIDALEESFTEKNDDKDQCIVMDYDNDGKSDIIIVEADYKEEDDIWSEPWGEYRSAYVAWYRSTGTAFTLDKKLNTQDNYSYIKNNMIGDFNGDGLTDLLSYSTDLYNGVVKDGNFHLHTSASPYEAGTIKSITDGMDNTLSFEYKPLTDNSVYTHDGTNENGNTIVELTAPLRVLSKSSLTNGSTQRNIFIYNYSNALFHTQGKGFLGFKSMTVTDQTAGIQTTTNNVLNTQYFLLYPESSVTKTTDGSLMQTSSQTFLLTPNTSNSKIFTLLPTSQTVKDELTGAKVITAYTYSDLYGNPKYITKTYDNGLVEKETYQYYIKKGSWCLNVPQNGTITKTYNSNTYNLNKYYSYDTRGHVTIETVAPENSNSIVNNYTYDTFGNLIKTTTTTNGITRETSASYGSTSGRFLISKTDIFGDVSTYNYSLIGLLTSMIEHVGTDRVATTSFQYDGFGRNIKTIYPDGNIQTTAWSWDEKEGSKYMKATTLSGKPTQKTWYNSYNEEVLRSSTGMDDKEYSISTSRLYDGKVSSISTPYIREGYFSYYPKDSYTYDKFNRVVSHKTMVVNIYPLVETTYAYSGLKVTETSPEATIETMYDGVGQKAYTITNGKKVSFDYYASGLLKSSTPENGTAIVMEYDIFGNRTKITDPNAGVITSKYNGFGELLETQQAVHNTGEIITTGYVYSANGLLAQQTLNGKTTQYTYDNYNRLISEEINNEHKIEYTYDTFDRIKQTKETIDGNKIFTSKLDYDGYGNIVKETYPDDYFVQNNYSNYGYLKSVQNSSGTKLWEALTCNVNGQLTSQKIGNLTQTNTYYTSGLPMSESCIGIFGLQYTFDNKKNMQNKKNLLTGQTEKYSYDSMNRLTQWNIYDSNNLTLKNNGITYDYTQGNISNKSDVDYEMQYGEFGYPAHAVTSVSADIDEIPRLTQVITYTDFKKVASIEEGSNKLVITYGTDQQRRKSIFYQDNVAKLTRYYLGNYEEEIDASSGNIRKIHYISGANGLAAIYVDNSNINDSLYYAFTDYQSNLIAITDATGTAIQKLAYDPWGARRKPDDWSQKADDNTHFIFNRGYTLHEHIPSFGGASGGLINMNGRVYDPVLGMFISPDPYVQTPDNWINYNRYSYCYNNPLIYTDKTGMYATYELANNQMNLARTFGCDPSSVYQSGSEYVFNTSKFGMDQSGTSGFSTEITCHVNTDFSTTAGLYSGAKFSSFNKIESSSSINFSEFNESITKLVDGISNSIQSSLYESSAWYSQGESQLGSSVAQGGGGWYDNMGVYITSTALTAEDVYNNFGHNHTTYTTTGGVTANIYELNGAVRSTRAAQFATLSKAVSYAGTAGTALMTAQSGTKIYNGSATGLDYSDFTVGTVGLMGAFSELGGYTIPGIGQGVALYSWSRLWFDLGAQYGPSQLFK